MAELAARVPCAVETRDTLRALKVGADSYQDVLEWLIPVGQEVDRLRESGESPPEAAERAIRVLREHHEDND